MYCMCFYLFSKISNYNRIFRSVYRSIFISILEKLSTSTSFPLISPSEEFKSHLYPQLSDIIHCWHFGYFSMDVCARVCKFMEVILCKLLPQFFFFLEKITSINENIFSFFYKRCRCFCFFSFRTLSKNPNILHSCF